MADQQVIDVWTDGAGRIVPAQQAVRLERCIYGADGNLVRREYYVARSLHGSVFGALSVPQAESQ